MKDSKIPKNTIGNLIDADVRETLISKSPNLLAEKKQQEEDALLKQTLLRGQSVWTSDDFTSQSARELHSNMKEGKFDIPTSVLPLDFHQFWMVNYDYSKDSFYRDQVVKAEFGFTHEWAFNTVISNYPSISIDANVVKLSLKLFKSKIPPSPRFFKYLSAFIDKYTLPYLIRQSTVKLRNLYRRFEKSLDHLIPKYSKLDDVDRQDLAEKYFQRIWEISAATRPASYKGRFYYPILPKELLNNYLQRFKIASVHMIRLRQHDAEKVISVDIAKGKDQSGVVEVTKDLETGKFKVV